MSGRGFKDRILKPKPRLKFVAIKNAKDHKEAAENNKEQYKASGQDLVEKTATEMLGVSIDDLRKNMLNKNIKEAVERSPDKPIEHIKEGVGSAVDYIFDKVAVPDVIDYANKLLADGVSEEEAKKRLYDRMKNNPLLGTKNGKIDD